MTAPQVSPEIVVIGGSAGSIQALADLVAGLPSGFDAAVLVAVHLPPDGHSFLPEILSRAGPLPAAHGRDAERLQPGRVYVAPPDHHLVVEDGRLQVIRGPRENGHRPSIDALFRSAAQWYGSGVVAVLLSGALSDGVAGIRAVKRAGGTTIAQDPEDALVSSMPAGAIERVGVDETRPAREIGSLLGAIVGSSGSGRAEPATQPRAVAEAPAEDVEPGGVPSVFSCPDCGGVLWEFRGGEVTRYRCRVGHAYSAEGLDDSQRHHLEDALWAALRALDESVEMSARLAERAWQQGLDAAGRRFEGRARASRQQSDLIRAALESVSPGEPREVPEPLRGEIEFVREQAGRDERRHEASS